jgi:benzoyl-CoA-dihydrodiol lyase
VRERAEARAASSDRPADANGIQLEPLRCTADADGTRRYDHLEVTVDRTVGAVFLTLHGPDTPPPRTPDELVAAGASAWLITACRQLDDAILHLRFNEPELGTWVLATRGDPAAVLAADKVLAAAPDHWLVREVRRYWARTLKRLDLSARSLLALVEPGSCFAGTLAELALAADRSFMLDGEREDDPAAGQAPLILTDANDGWYPMSNGLSRLQARFWGDDEALDAARSRFGKELLAQDAAAAGLVTFTPDDIDWEEEVRVALEERNSFSPDALTGMEANYRFVGPETMESKIFARLTAWQNWIFQRPNAVGPEGALRRFGTGSRPTYDRARV